MKTETEQRTENLAYIKEHLGIDPKATPDYEASNILRQHKINTTSWVLSALEAEYGKVWADNYRFSIKDLTCIHGMFAPCPYCKWGTD